MALAFMLLWWRKRTKRRLLQRQQQDAADALVAMQPGNEGGYAIAVGDALRRRHEADGTPLRAELH